MPPLRRLEDADVDAVLEVYRDAVLSQTGGLYSPAQIQAWAEHAGRDPAVRLALQER